MEEQADWGAEKQEPAVDEPDGFWEYELISERMYGRARCRVDRWPLQGALPREIRWHIDLGVRRLLQRAARSGWSAAEPTDAQYLWRAGRIGYRLNNNPVAAGDRCDLTFQRLHLNCQRWVPSAAVQDDR